MAASTVKERMKSLEITHDCADDTQQDTATKVTQQENGDQVDDTDDGNGEESEVAKNGVQLASLLELIGQRVDEAIEAGKEGNDARTLGEHHRYHRAIYDKLRDEVALRDDIPNAIHHGPLKELTLKFCHSSLAGHCPCCYDCLDFPTVMVRAGDDDLDGITKDHVITAIRDELHPETKETDDKQGGVRPYCLTSAG